MKHFVVYSCKLGKLTTGFGYHGVYNPSVTQEWVRRIVCEDRKKAAVFVYLCQVSDEQIGDDSFHIQEEEVT